MLVSPAKMIGEAGPSMNRFPGLQVARYAVIGLPPSLIALENANVACAFPGTVVLIDGALGMVALITMFWLALMLL